MVGSRKRLSVAVALAALAIAGCGGGGDEATEPEQTQTPEAPTALNKEELLAQGDAVCAEVNAAVGTVGSTSTGADGQASQVASLYGGMAERLKGLGAPSDDDTGYSEFISAAEQLAQAESDVALAAERGEGEALSSAESDADAARASFQAAASAYGFEQCGEAPRAPTPGSGQGEEPEAPSEAPGGEAAPEAGEEAAPETGGAGGGEEGSPGGGAAPGSGDGGGGGSSGGIGPG